MQTHFLEKTSSSRLEFKLKSKSFPFLFMGVGAVIRIGMPLGFALEGKFEIPSLIMFLFGAVFFGVGYWVLRLWSSPIVFDLDSDYYWQGRYPVSQIHLNKWSL